MLGAGAGIQAYGAIQQGKAAEAQGKAEQKLAEYNASIKEQEAVRVRERAIEEARQFEEEGKGFLGTQKVGLAKGGVLSSTGTPALLLEETRRNLEADRTNIIKEGYLAESYRKSEAIGLRYQGGLAKASGQNARTGSYYSAAGSLLTGLGSAAYTYKSIKK
jgi:hypothetical protein